MPRSIWQPVGCALLAVLTFWALAAALIEAV